jgi:hypothetical protein
VFWKSHVRENNMKATDTLIRADDLAQAGKYAEAEQKFKEVEQSTYGIAAIAKLEHAKLLLAEGKPADAQALYREIANYAGSGADEALRDFAALDAAVLAGKHNPPDNSGLNRPFDSLSQELYALELGKEGKVKEARDILDNIAGNPSLPASEQKRAGELREGMKGKN